LISLDTPERSVLFRVMGDGAATRVEYRSMNCRFDPNLDVPAEAYRAISGVR
jgi:glutamine synthetase